ncbi:MAG: hypothetical protein NZ898_07605 [Myxococcota bacterium]|nr:hypothetical protein [Myxococcota bacterium]MDW8363034.1 hypothetical protein [Myxococcales bacterium]
MDERVAQDYADYLARLEGAFGPGPQGQFVKFGKHLVARLGPEDFARRRANYLELDRAVRQMLATGATINDALVLEYQEASAWLLLEPLDPMRLFRGELGDPAHNLSRRTVGDTARG